MKKIIIPEKMQKFYGTGIMLHPDKEMVEEMIQKIPYGKITTIDVFCQKLARDHHANVTCPMRTGNFVKAITKTHANSGVSIPFWRIIRKNLLLINSPFTEICAENLENEGFQINQTNKGAFEVLCVENRLFTFEAID